MAISNTDLILVQRGNVPYRTTTETISNYVIDNIDTSQDIAIATDSSLGVIRVGANLSIEAGTGILSAVIPPGLEYQGLWTDAVTSPSTVGIANGNFWIWEGGDEVELTGASYSSIQGEVVSNGDRIMWSFNNNWSLLRSSGGGGGGAVQEVTANAPINITGTTAEPVVNISAATTGQAGSMSATDKVKLNGITEGAEPNVSPTATWNPASESGTLILQPGADSTLLTAATTDDAGLLTAADKAKLDGLSSPVNPTANWTATASSGTLTLLPGGDTTSIPEATDTVAGLFSAADKTTLENIAANPGGVLSITGGTNITVTGTAGVPIVNVATNSFIPYDLLDLNELPS